MMTDSERVKFIHVFYKHVHQPDESAYDCTHNGDTYKHRRFRFQFK